MQHDGLELGMFLGGLLVAAVPISLMIGVGIYVLKRYLEDRSRLEDGSRKESGSG